LNRTLASPRAYDFSRSIVYKTELERSTSLCALSKGKGQFMGKLDGKVAAITGAGGGIGRALAKAMAAQGACIVANDLGTTLAGDRAPTSPANDVVAEIKAAGGRAVANLMDISTMEGGKGLVDQAVKEFGKLDILVNLAGVIRDRMIFNMEEEDWDRVLDSHLKGTFCTSRFASAHMRERRCGRIINFSSNAALGSPGQPSYTAAKAGILGLTFSTAQGLRRYGITCNAIFPVAATRMTDTIHQAESRITPSAEAQGTPFDPVNVAPIVIFLASDEAAEITGQVFGSAGYSVTRYKHMSPEKTLYNKRPWELDDFFEAMKRTLARDLQKPRMS
jgi:NAD(P)-dependent dehydrogenase (short-subunit alcohol dehydrogenase family)